MQTSQTWGSAYFLQLTTKLFQHFTVEAYTEATVCVPGRGAGTPGAFRCSSSRELSVSSNAAGDSCHSSAAGRSEAAEVMPPGLG